MTASIDRLHTLVKDDLTKVNDRITENLNSSVQLIPDLASHIIDAGGKRLRPMLTLAAANLFDYDGDAHIGLAASIEFIHTATLLHDDVVDESEKRRGKPSANAIWGNKPSVLVGDFLFSRAFQQMLDTRSLGALSILADTSVQIAQGEVKQLVIANDLGVTLDDHISVLRAKTAELFAAASKIGAMIAGADDTQQQNLYDYGLNLGLSFQLVDDILDYETNDEKIGKNLGDDFREGKITLPVILAYQKSDDEERAFWQRTMGNVDQTNDDFATAISIIKKYDTLAQSKQKAEEYGEQAKACLDSLPHSNTRAAMIEAVDFCINRLY